LPHAHLPARARSKTTPTPTPGKSEYVEGLTLAEAATLLNVDVHDPELTAAIFETARQIKARIYGNRIVLFSPLYLASWCVNSCTYCAFRAGNKTLRRSALTDAELVLEVEALQRQGHRRLLVLTGEHPRYSFNQFLHALDVIAAVKTDPCGGIRRLNVEIPSLSVSDMRRLKATDKVGTFTLFQETYHRPTFARVHVSGPKSDYGHRLLTQDRALRAGLDDVGVGALFGLADYRYEALGLLSHAQHLEAEYGAGPHTISIPRLRPADGSELASAPPCPVDDAHFKALVAILRIAVPYTGMILSTRESPEMREALLQVGISQMSAGSRTDVGGELCCLFSRVCLRMPLRSYRSRANSRVSHLHVAARCPPPSPQFHSPHPLSCRAPPSPSSCCLNLMPPPSPPSIQLPADPPPKTSPDTTKPDANSLPP